MSKIQKAMEAYQKAVELRKGNDDLLKELTQKQKKELDKIDNDILLSPEGKLEKKKEYKQQSSEKILKQLHDRREQYKKLLREAKENAHDIYYHSVKAPDEKKIIEFEAELNQLKTELMLSTREATARQKLDSFISKLNDPYLANKAAESFGELSGHILGVADNPQRTKLELSQKYTKLRNDNLTEDQQQARNILEQTESAENNPSFYSNPLIEADSMTPSFAKNLMSTLDEHAGKYIDNTDAYFSEKGEIEDTESEEENEAKGEPAYAESIAKMEEIISKLRGKGEDE